MRREGEQERGIGTAETLTLPDADAPPAPAAATLDTGSRVDRFVILERLGQGGMGVVFSAFDPQLDRKVAIKFLHRDIGDQERLLREAQAMARLSHPNVVQVFDVGSFHGRVFVAMEFVDGGTLKAWLREQPRTWAELWPVMRGAARGLAAAHQAGIVHRDFKPDNVLVDRDGRARVTDFGLARSSEGQGRSSDGGTSALGEPLTRTGAVVGTPLYMAPEQHLGEKTDAASDQFAFCVTLYEALYAARPFAGDTVAELADAVTGGRVEPPPKQSAVPRWRRDLVLRGLDRKPSARFPSMDALVAALDRDPAAARRRAIAAAAALLVVGAAVALLWLRSGRSESTVCKGARDRLAGVWDEDRAAQLRAAFGAIGKPYATDAAERVVARLDRRADDWVTMRTEACEATHVTGEQSDSLLDLRMRCLERRRVDLDALVDLFTEAPGPEVVQKSLTLESQLSLDGCADGPALMAEVPPPDAPAAREQVDRLRERIARDVAPRAQIAPSKARDVLTAMEAEVRASPSVSLHAEFAMWAGELADTLGEPQKARTYLDSALGDAAAARDFRLASRIWYKRIVLEDSLGSVDSAKGLLIGARAAVAAAGMGPIEESRLLIAEARVLGTAGDLDGALAALERAHRLRVDVFGADDLKTLLTEQQIATLLSRKDDVAAGRKRTEALLPRLEALLGRNHPDLLPVLSGLAIAHRSEGNYDAAMAIVDRALAIARAAGGGDVYEARLAEIKGSLCARKGDHQCSIDQQRESVRIRRAYAGAPSPDLGQALLSLGNALKAAGRYQEARAPYEEALEVLARSIGDKHSTYGIALMNYAALLVNLNDQQGALDAYRRVIAVFDQAQGVNKRMKVFALLGQADALISAGQARDAVAPAQRAVELAEGGNVEALALELARLALGRSLHESGQDPRRGAKLVLDARAHLAAMGPGTAQQVQSTDRWLARRKIRNPGTP